MIGFAAYFDRESARLWSDWIPGESLDRHESGAAFIAFAHAQYEHEHDEKKNQGEQTNLFGE